MTINIFRCKTSYLNLNFQLYFLLKSITDFYFYHKPYLQRTSTGSGVWSSHQLSHALRSVVRILKMVTVVKTLVVLTLEQHRHGIWITRLVETLRELDSKPWTNVRVVALESIFPMDPNDSHIHAFLVSSPGRWQQEQQQERQQDDEKEDEQQVEVVGLVNRVSDAAPPELAQLCTAVLQLATSRHIPVFNGPASYSLCTQKWCHHALFRQAQLSCPATRALMKLPSSNDDDDADDDDDDNNPSRSYRRQIQQASQQLKDEEHEPLPHLIKPNAGGFGAGIQRLSTLDDLDQLPTTDDSPAHSIVLIQSYQVPRDQYIYRIWFLCGKVQCGMRRLIMDPNKNTRASNSTPSEFTSGCAGGSACAWKPKAKTLQLQAHGADTNMAPLPEIAAATDSGDATPPPSLPPAAAESPFEVWEVSEDVRRELEDQLLPTLPRDFHAGSVEFLHGRHHGDDSTFQRLYFDLNLLSTLPTLEQEKQLRLQYHRDVWAELAMAVAATVVTDAATDGNTHVCS